MSLIEYLKSPELVVAVQEWFGVKYKNTALHTSDEDEGLPADHTTRPSSSTDNNPMVGGLHKRNVSSGSSDEGFNEPLMDTANESQQDSAAEANAYEITNWFWYYLFFIGTEFGDEIFYATMIPFWFWNVDGAVGRRVVFVWAVVMYIGKSRARAMNLLKLN